MSTLRRGKRIATSHGIARRASIRPNRYLDAFLIVNKHIIALTTIK
jgi:hypothetical protein